MINSWLMIFPSYRRAAQEYIGLQQEHEHLKRMVADYARIVDQLESANSVLQQQQSPENVIDLFKKFQEDLLTEQPYPEGKIPDNVWLTPVDTRIASADNR